MEKKTWWVHGNESGQPGLLTISQTRKQLGLGGGTQNLFSSHPLSPARPTSSRFCSLSKQYPTWRLESSNGSLWGTFHIVHTGAWFQPLSAELLSVLWKPMPEQEEH